MAVLKIEGDASGALRSIGQIEKALGTLQGSVSASQKAVSGLTSTMQALAGAVVGASLFKFVDDLQNMQNKLRIATTSQADFNNSLDAVKAIADKTGQSLSAIGSLYASVSQNADKLGYNTDQVTTVTNAMATALKASGASAEGARSTLYQFSQIMAKGKVNGDEFTTIMENLGGPVMDLIAKKMGLSTAEFIKFKEKGLIGAKDFTDALIRSMGELDTMGGKALPTLGQNLQRIQNSFGDFIIKVDQATGFTTMLGNAMTWLSKNIDTVLPIIAAFAGAWAGMKIAAIVVSLYEMVKAIRAIGVAAAVTEALATGGIAAVGAIAGATAAYVAANALFEKVDGNVKEMNVDLKATGQAAAQGLGETNKQLTGISEKFKDIIKDLNLQLGISTTAAEHYQTENQLLTYKKQLENSMTAEQEKQIRGLLTRIELNRAVAQIDKDIYDTSKGVLATLKHDIGERRVATELEAKRKQYGDAAFESRQKELEAVIKQNIAAEAAVAFADRTAAFAGEQAAAVAQGAIAQERIRQYEAMRMQYGKAIADEYRDQLNTMVAQQLITKELTALEAEAALAKQAAFGAAISMKDVSSQQLDINIKQNEALYKLQGTQTILSEEQRKSLFRAIEETELARKRLEYYKQMKSAVEAVNNPLTGAAAGASAAGQLGQLDPVKAAQTANETLFNGLAQLRADDLISEQQYQTAKIAAAVQANDAIMAAQQKMYESQKMYQLQNQQSSIFGYEQQKQIAQDSAKFQMKSDFEKTQFAVENIGSVFTALGAQNKKAFEASKAFNIATALMNTYMGATKALATYPWPFGMIAAAGAVAMGLAQVAQIRSQTYSGRALGGPVMGGQSYIVGENGPELFTPNTTGSITRNGDLQGGKNVNVNFTIVANDTTGFDQLLASRKGVITQIINDAVLEKGRRSIA